MKSQENQVIGKIHFLDHNGNKNESIEYTNSEEYLDALQKEFDSNMGGFKHETLTKDAQIRKSVDDIIWGISGMDNPRTIEEYKLTGSS